jgi:hypothetical protein
MFNAVGITQTHPMAGESLAADWAEKVSRKAHLKKCSSWQSLSNRLARLICAATRKDQSKRPEFSQLCSELELLLEVCRHPEAEESAELWAEELFARAMPHKEYVFNEETRTISATFASGVSISFTPDEGAGFIELSVNYQSRGNETYKSVGKYLPPAVDQMVSRLRAGGWKISTSHRSHNTAKVNATVDISSLKEGAPKAVAAIAETDKLFDFQ